MHGVNSKIGRRRGGGQIRGEEMMMGPERSELERAVWGPQADIGDDNGRGFEVTVGRGDALFIPKGWWHSIKSVGMDITASVSFSSLVGG